jgi:hypothetical protein
VVAAQEEEGVEEGVDFSVMKALQPRSSVCIVSFAGVDKKNPAHHNFFVLNSIRDWAGIARLRIRTCL